MMRKITSPVEAWPILLLGPLLVATAFHWVDYRDAASIAVILVRLFAVIWLIRSIIDGMRGANRAVQINTLGVLLFLWVCESLAVGFLLPHPVDGQAFYTIATVDGAILIAIVVSPGIPKAWNTDDRTKWTWVAGVVIMIFTAIGVAVVGGIIAGHPTAKSFNKALLSLHFGNHAFVLEPSTFLLGVTLFPLVLGVISLAVWMRLRVISPESP